MHCYLCNEPPLLLPLCIYLGHLKVLCGLAFCLFTIYSHFMVCIIFICPYYTDSFSNPSMNVIWEFYQNSRQTKKLKNTIKSLNNFWKQSMFTTLFWLSLNSFDLPEGWDTFQMIQKHPTQYRNFLENKGTVWTICKIFQGKFPYNLEIFKTLWELSRRYGKWT